MANRKKQPAAAKTAQPDPREQRQWPRVRVLLNARLVTTSDDQPVKIRDISQGGVMIEALRPLDKGRDVVLVRGETEYFARIAWTKGNEYGLQFDEPLGIAELQAFVHQAPRPPVIIPDILARPAAAADGPSPERWALTMAHSWTRPRPARGTFEN